MAKKPTVTVPLDELQTALQGDSNTKVTADLSDFNAGESVLEKARAVQALPLEAAQQASEDTLSTKIAAAAQESYTGYIAEALDRSYNDQFTTYDHSFDATRRALEMTRAMGIPETEENLSVLARAGNEDDMTELAHRLYRHVHNQEILSRNGGAALASGMLDPTTLLADFATFGAARGLKLGRLAAGVMGATAGTALTGAADVAGRDVTGVEYITNAALTGGAMALFGSGIPKGWYGEANIPGTNGQVSKWINAQLSEFDKLATASPEAGNLMAQLSDDPVRRSNLLTNNNAASYMRRYQNEMDGFVKQYDDALEQALAQDGASWLQRRLDWSGKYGEMRDSLNREVATELLRRDEQWRIYGNVFEDASVSANVKRLADISDQLHGRMGELARDAGVRGFEDFKARPGYFHRSWNDSLIRRMEAEHPGSAHSLLAASAKSGIANLEQREADEIARALIRRVRDKATGDRSDFMGGLGQADTAYLREALERAKVEPGVLDSIMHKIEQKQSDQGTVQFGKHRLTLDMSVESRMADGTIYKMTDLIDTDMDRLIENYASAMSGRAALGKVGIADDADLAAWRRSYQDSISHLPQAEQDDLMQQLDGLLGDFTGRRPEANILGQMTQRVKSIADATMLSASGFWQVGEYATMAQRHGVVETGKEFMRQFPGIKSILKNANKDPDLADELYQVLNVDLARDVRLRPWKRQHDAMLASRDTAFDRVLHFGKQAVPYLNGMKYVHSHQARMNANLVLNKFARAAKGDESAVKQIMQYAPDLDWPSLKKTIETNVTYTSRNNAQSFNWGGWGRGEIDTIMNVALRMMDDSLLFGRSGQGASFSRSAVGQVIGQFRSFVSFAHNKLLRGTLQNEGVGGLATLLAFQYPLTFLAVSANEARKGNLDLSEKGMQDMAKKAIGYTAGLGFVADAAGIIGLTSGKPGITTPMLSLAEAPARLLGGVGKVVGGEAREGAYDIGKAASLVIPFVNVMPGSALALDAIKGD